MMHAINRRQFVGQTLGLTALTATVPGFLHQTGQALAGDGRRDSTPIPGLKDGRVLVVVQLAGGNDGLNTLVPHGQDAYYQARPRLGIEARKVLKINDHVGLHPEMVELRKLYDEGGLALVQNVGYPNPNRSHFRATDIWETGSPADKTWTTGWLGRYFDSDCLGARTPVLGLQLGQRPALSFAHPRPRGVTLANPAILDWPVKGAEAEALHRIHQVRASGIDTLDFLQAKANETLSLSRRLQEVVGQRKSAVEYPPFAFCQTLRQVAGMIAAEVPTRVIYVSLGGFDTHAGQANRHAALLQELEPGSGCLPQGPRDHRPPGEDADHDLLGVWPARGRESRAPARTTARPTCCSCWAARSSPDCTVLLRTSTTWTRKAICFIALTSARSTPPC